MRLLATRAPRRTPHDARPAARSAVRHHEHLAPHLGPRKLRAAFLRTITVFDLISEHALISGHPPFFVLKKNLFFLLFFNKNYFILIFIIISSDFCEGNTSLLYTGLMATRALTLRVHLLGQNKKIFFGAQTNLLSGLSAN